MKVSLLALLGNYDRPTDRLIGKIHSNKGETEIISPDRSSSDSSSFSSFLKADLFGLNLFLFSSSTWSDEALVLALCLALNRLNFGLNLFVRGVVLELARPLVDSS